MALLSLTNWSKWEEGENQIPEIEMERRLQVNDLCRLIPPSQDSKSNIERILYLNSKPLFFFHVFSCRSINLCMTFNISGFEATDSAQFDRAFWLGMVDHWTDLFIFSRAATLVDFSRVNLPKSRTLMDLDSRLLSCSRLVRGRSGLSC
jgi:hypothetical protein